MTLAKKTAENSAKNTLEGRFVDSNGNWYRGVIQLDVNGDQVVPKYGDLITKDGKTSQFVVLGFTDTDTVHLDTGSVTTQKAFMLVDLSDTVNWKHTNTGHINLEYINIVVDPDSSFVGEIKFGFLTNVGVDNGDFNQIHDIDMRRKSDLLVDDIAFGSHGFDCTTVHHFGPITANSLLFQTDVDLQGPNGATSFPSGNGDLVMLIELSAGSVNVSVLLGYDTAE